MTPETKKAPLPSKLDQAKQEAEVQSKAQKDQDNEEPQSMENDGEPISLADKRDSDEPEAVEAENAE